MPKYPKKVIPLFLRKRATLIVGMTLVGAVMSPTMSKTVGVTFEGWQIALIGLVMGLSSVCQPIMERMDFKMSTLFRVYYVSDLATIAGLIGYIVDYLTTVEFVVYETLVRSFGNAFAIQYGIRIKTAIGKIYSSVAKKFNSSLAAREGGMAAVAAIFMAWLLYFQPLKVGFGVAAAALTLMLIYELRLQKEAILLDAKFRRIQRREDRLKRQRQEEVNG